jgi:hypothetical protein
MGTKAHKIESKWFHAGRVRLTGEYGGGVIAGSGLGIVTMVTASPTVACVCYFTVGGRLHLLWRAGHARIV